MQVIKLLEKGLPRVLDGEVGMTFVVEATTKRIAGDGIVAHVRDYRYHNGQNDYQIWSIGPEGYEVVIE